MVIAPVSSVGVMPGLAKSMVAVVFMPKTVMGFVIFSDVINFTSPHLFSRMQEYVAVAVVYFCVECAYDSTGSLSLWSAMLTVKLVVGAAPP